MFNNYKKLKISLDEFIFLMYLSNQGDSLLFNPETICKDLGIDLKEVMNYISVLSEKHLLTVETIKNEKGLIEELSPMEYEIIKAWLENNMSEEIITEALKEATFNGVSNLRYIDKILYEWGKLGLKTKEDVMKNKMKRRKEKEQPSEIFDYDWFDDDE